MVPPIWTVAVTSTMVASPSGRSAIAELPLRKPALAKVVAGAPSSPARPIAEVDVESARAQPTGVSELDRVLGGGLVPLAASPNGLPRAAGQRRLGRGALYT